MASKKDDDETTGGGPAGCNPLKNLAELRAYYGRSLNYYRTDPKQIKFEVLSGLTVAILKVPESVAFSFVAGVHPLQGLYGTFFLGMIASVMGGRPGMVSGCAGALAVVVRVIMSDDGPFGDKCLSDRREFVFFTMFWCGIMQVICGFLRLAEGAKLISQSAFLGFFNALAIVIGSSQLETFHRPKDKSQSTGALETHGTAVGCGPVDFGASGDADWYTLEDKETWLMFIHIAVVMSIIQFLPKIPVFKVPGTKMSIKAANILPPCLVGILLSMAIEWGIFRGALGVSTTIVKDVSPIAGDPPQWHIPDVAWGEWESYARCLPISASLCAIGLVESILTLQAVDEILDETTPNWMKHLECVAQGVGNGVSGLFMALGGDAMIGQSCVNALNGARGRLSSLTADFSVLLFVVVASSFIEVVPMAGLAGILFIVVMHCFQWQSVVLIVRRQIPFYESCTIILVTVLAVQFNLAVGVGVGVLWESVCRAGLGSAARVRVLDEPVTQADGKLQKTYLLDGVVYFANSSDFCKLFDPAGDPPAVVADFSNCQVADYSAFFALNRVGKRYKDLGKVLIISLAERDYEFYARLGSGLPDIVGVVFKPPLQQPAQPAVFQLPEGAAEQMAKAKAAPGDGDLEGGSGASEQAEKLQPLGGQRKPQEAGGTLPGQVTE